MIVVIDGMNEFYKNYFKLKDIVGESIAGFYGTIRSILSYKKKYGKIIVIWEGKSTKRITEDKNYKSHKTKMSDSFYEQLDDCKKFLSFFITQYKVNEYECDDMLATIAWKRHLKNKKTLIITSDDDLHQLINENISVLSRKVVYDMNNLKYKNVKKLVLLWALQGDGSDNITGIKGIRGKEELVDKYFENDKQILEENDIKKLLDNFIKNLETNNNKYLKVIKDNYDKILLNMNLIRLRIVPKENYSKIEKNQYPDDLIKKYKCYSLRKVGEFKWK